MTGRREALPVAQTRPRPAIGPPLIEALKPYLIAHRGRGATRLMGL